METSVDRVHDAGDASRAGKSRGNDFLKHNLTHLLTSQK